MGVWGLLEGLMVSGGVEGVAGFPGGNNRIKGVATASE